IGQDAQDTALERLDVGSGFVALNREEQVAGAHLLAVALEPLDEDTFFHGPSKPWHHELNCHRGTPYQYCMPASYSATRSRIVWAIVCGFGTTAASRVGL